MAKPLARCSPLSERSLGRVPPWHRAKACQHAKLSILLLLEMFVVVHWTFWHALGTGHLAMPHLHHVDEATDPEEAQKSNHEAPQHHQEQEGEGPRLASEEQQQAAQATVCPVP